jgi:hypothetical protein
MERETVKTFLFAEKLDGPGCTVTPIAHHGMTREPGMAPDLMSAAGQEIALDERVMSAFLKDPEACFGLNPLAPAFGTGAPSRILGQGPDPDPPAFYRLNLREISMEECDIALPDRVALKLCSEVAEDRRPACQEDHSARLPVEAMDGKDSEPGIVFHFFFQFRIGLDPGLQDRTEVRLPVRLNAQARRLLHNEPPRSRRMDDDGKRICCHLARKRTPNNIF